MSYNGWTNRATWLINLWAGEMLADIAEGNGGKIDASQAESLIEEILSQDGATVEGGFAADLLTYALADVNWREIAQAASEGVAA